MRIDLSDQTAVVTGSTAGIGFAIARGLAAAGATVVLNGPTEALVAGRARPTRGRAARHPSAASRQTSPAPKAPRRWSRPRPTPTS